MPEILIFPALTQIPDNNILARTDSIAFNPNTSVGFFVTFNHSHSPFALAIAERTHSAVLGLFVHRPPECGEPAACGDEHLFPTLYFSGLALGSTVVIAVIQARQSPRRFLIVMSSWAVLLTATLAITYAVGGG